MVILFCGMGFASLAFGLGLLGLCDLVVFRVGF